MQKYIDLWLVLDWIRSERKSIYNFTNKWKAMTISFVVIGSFMVWEVGNGSQARICAYDIMGCGMAIYTLNELIHYLHMVGKVTLSHIASPKYETIWSQGWLSFEDFGFRRELGNWLGQFYCSPQLGSQKAKVGY
jgi:hypothetical protein